MLYQLLMEEGEGSWGRVTLPSVEKQFDVNCPISRRVPRAAVSRVEAEPLIEKGYYSRRKCNDYSARL